MSYFSILTIPVDQADAAVEYPVIKIETSLIFIS